MSKNNKKLIIWLLVIIAIVLCLNIAITCYLSKQYKLNFTNFTADVLYNVNQEYGLAETKIINDIFSKNTKLNNEILNKYGIDSSNIDYLSYNKKINACVISLSVILIGFCIFVLVKYIKNQNKKINDMSKYLDQILNQNYDLDIDDNDEGSISILKNKIYDITVMLKEKKDMFDLISDISHQIKTPLTSLNLLTNLLYDDSISIEQRQKFLDEMSKQVNKIQWFIKNILNIAKIDSKTLVFKKQNTNAYLMLQKCIKEFEIIAQLQNIQINLLECDKNIYFLIDEKWTSEVIENLIKNAIEHKSKIINISCTQNNLYTKICVSDDGEGIEKEDIFHIFERFYKAKNSNSNSLGLGLSFCKSVIEAQNGYIKVKSQKLKGTSFDIKIYKDIV